MVPPQIPPPGYSMPPSFPKPPPVAKVEPPKPEVGKKRENTSTLEQPSKKRQKTGNDSDSSLDELFDKQESPAKGSDQESDADSEDSMFNKA